MYENILAVGAAPFCRGLLGCTAVSSLQDVTDFTKQHRWKQGTAPLSARAPAGVCQGAVGDWNTWASGEKSLIKD